MARHNFEQLTGASLDSSFHLEIEQPVIADARMMPHEWMVLDEVDCRLTKLDSAMHGDGHFFPGACDIAWDLAGAIVEWGMTRHATEFLLRAYRNASGDDATSRVEAYITAYAAFQAGYSAMAAHSMRGSAEESLHRRDCVRYSRVLQETSVQTGMQAVSI